MKYLKQMMLFLEKLLVWATNGDAATTGLYLDAYNSLNNVCIFDVLIRCIVIWIKAAVYTVQRCIYETLL